MSSSKTRLYSNAGLPSARSHRKQSKSSLQDELSWPSPRGKCKSAAYYQSLLNPGMSSAPSSALPSASAIGAAAMAALFYLIWVSFLVSKQLQSPHDLHLYQFSHPAQRPCCPFPSEQTLHFCLSASPSSKCSTFPQRHLERKERHSVYGTLVFSSGPAHSS